MQELPFEIQGRQSLTSHTMSRILFLDFVYNVVLYSPFKYTDILIIIHLLFNQSSMLIQSPLFFYQCFIIIKRTITWNSRALDNINLGPYSQTILSLDSN